MQHSVNSMQFAELIFAVYSLQFAVCGMKFLNFFPAPRSLLPARCSLSEKENYENS